MRYPDSTTRWRATARAADATTRFGVAEAHARTRPPLEVRLQAPRFVVVGDRCVGSALLVRPALAADGLHRVSSPDGLVRIPAGGQARVDWPVSASEPGTARLQVSAATAAGDGALSDAMERSLPVYEHGIDKLVAKSAKMTATELALRLDLPAARRAGSTEFDVRVAPSLAVTMLDALPYLVDYPYGCVEQTMSRFLPAVVTARTLAELGLEPADVAGRVFGGVELFISLELADGEGRRTPATRTTWRASTRSWPLPSRAWSTSSTPTAAGVGGSTARATRS